MAQSHISFFPPSLPLFSSFLLFLEARPGFAIVRHGEERRGRSHSYAAYVAANELISNAVMTQAVMAIVEQFSRLPLSLVADLSAPPGKFCINLHRHASFFFS